ncbi:MAG: ABC transporter permease [Chloroflexi bacterium]|nr:ABC transporter permease [Chloroflexota bacterium]
MGAFVVRRLLQAVLVLLGVSIFVFLLLRLSGDPAALLLPPDARQEDIEQLRVTLGLNDPLPVQYWRFLSGVLHGDFGQSLRSSQPALGLVLDRLPATIQLGATAMLFSLALALPIGVLSAVRRNTAIDYAARVLGLLGQGIPVFWLGIMLILVVSVNWRLLPPEGREGPESLVLPAITLGMYQLARTMRLTRSGMLEVLGQDYIRTARAKGLYEWLVVRRHAMKNMLIPIVTVIGLDLGTLIGGAVITETIFAWPGVGRLAITAINTRDYPVVQAAVFVVASSYVFINLGVDVLYGYLNPRIRLS